MDETTVRNGYNWLPKEKRKKILLCSDDLRTPSGIGTMSRELVLGTCHRFNFVQLGAAINHPEAGKRLDLNQAIETDLGITDPSVIIYPYNGYGDENIMRQLLETEKPDVIMHFTDPRFWGWLYQMEHEIKQKVPITYLCLWDDFPLPKWNAPFYASNDLMMSISKQSYAIHSGVLESVGVEVINN